MAQRKGWDELSPDYQKRLQRGGIDRTAYAAGASLKSARGHAATPEKPQRAAKELGARQAEQYRERRVKRQRTMRILDQQRGEFHVSGLRAKDRRKIQKYWLTVFDYLDGKATADDLKKFAGKGGEIGGYGNVPVYHLVTDPNVILRYQLRTGTAGFELYDEE